MLYFFLLKFACKEVKPKSRGYYPSVVNITTPALNKTLFSAHGCPYFQPVVVEKSILQCLWLYTLITSNNRTNTTYKMVCDGSMKKLSERRLLLMTCSTTKRSEGHLFRHSYLQMEKCNFERTYLTYRTFSGSSEGPCYLTTALPQVCQK